MDFDYDSDCDGGGVSDSDYSCYSGDGDDCYDDDSDVGDFDDDVNISSHDNFHDDLDVEIHAGEDLEADLGGDDRVLEPELGGDDRDLAAEFDGDNRDLEREIGIDGPDDSDGDVDIAAELGLGDGDYFDDSRELATGFEIHGGDYDVDGDDLSAVEVSSIVGDGFNGDRDFEVELGVLGDDGDGHLLEAESGLNVDDIYGVDPEEAMIAFLIDIGAHHLVPVVEVDDDDDDNDDSDEGGDELVPVVEVDDDDNDSDDYHNDISGDEVVPVVEVDDVISDYYYRGDEHLRVEDLDGEPLYMDDDEDFLLFRDNYTSTREITVQASPLMNSSSHGRVEHLIELNSSPNVRRNEEEKDGNLEKKLKDGEKTSSSEEDTNANGSENDGVSCPICLEPWTTDGDHIICCLPCGHVYGMSCIKSWLQLPNSEKCPLCNKVCSVEGIRKIYGLTIVTVEKDLKEKIQLLEARCASLELHNGDWQIKEAEWRQSEAVLLQQLKPNTN